jgi:hypothetical protein
MFSEAYIIFSLGLIKPLQKAEYPSCFTTYADCPKELTTVQNFVQICGIIAGKWLAGRIQRYQGHTIGVHPVEEELVLRSCKHGSCAHISCTQPSTYSCCSCYRGTIMGQVHNHKRHLQKPPRCMLQPLAYASESGAPFIP